jgi:hypothetical protein
MSKLRAASRDDGLVRASAVDPSAAVTRRPRAAGVMLLLMALTAVVYEPLVRAYFRTDDFFYQGFGVSVLTTFFPSSVVEGRRIQFVVDDPKVIEAAGHGRRAAGPLVPPS